MRHTHTELGALVTALGAGEMLIGVVTVADTQMWS